MYLEGIANTLSKTIVKKRMGPAHHCVQQYTIHVSMKILCPRTLVQLSPVNMLAVVILSFVV